MLQPVLRRPFLWLIALVLLAAGCRQRRQHRVQRDANRRPADGRAGRFVRSTGDRLQRDRLSDRASRCSCSPCGPCGDVGGRWRAPSRLPTAKWKQRADKRCDCRGGSPALTAIGLVSGRRSVPAGDRRLSSRRSSLRIAAHFVASFWMSGLIALAYSLCGVEFVVLRVLYPGMWRNARAFGDTARRELAPVTTHLRWIQWLAGSIPLLAAMLMLVLGGDATKHDISLARRRADRPRACRARIVANARDARSVASGRRTDEHEGVSASA